MVHIRQDVKEHCVLQLLVALHQAFNTKAKELVIVDIGVAVEELALCTHAHGVDTQADFTEKVLSKQRLGPVLILLILLFAQRIQICHDGIVRIPDTRKVSIVIDAEVVVETGHQNLQRIDVSIGEILIGAEEVLEIRDMLTQHSRLTESFRSILVGRFRSFRPLLRLKRVDDILTGHQIQIATAQIVAQLLVFLFRIQHDNRFACQTMIGQQELQQEALALTGVAQNQNIAVGLVVASPVKVHDDIGAIPVFADIETIGVSFTGIVQRIEIRHSGCREHTLKQRSESVASTGTDGLEAFLLSHSQSIHRDTLTGQLHADFCL